MIANVESSNNQKEVTSVRIDNNSIKISIGDNFSWCSYEKELTNNIFNAQSPLNVIWDITEMNKLPSPLTILKQLLLMKKNKKKIRSNIIKNIILVKLPTIKERLEWVFKNIYKPEHPVEIRIVEQ